MAIQNEKLHNQAHAVYSKLRRTPQEIKFNDSYKDRRKKQTAKLKPILITMQETFDKGETIANATSLKDYCKRYKDAGMLTYARCRQIITGKNGHEGKVKPVDSLDRVVLQPGMLIEVDGVTYRIPTQEESHAAHLSTTKTMTNPKFVSVILSSLEIMEPVKKTRLDAQDTRTAIDAVKKSLGTDDGTAAWYGKYKDAVVTASTGGNWTKVTLDAVMKDINKVIFAREVLEDDAKGWTKTARCRWNHEDGRKIKKTGRTTFTTFGADGLSINNSTTLAFAMGERREPGQVTVVLPDCPVTSSEVEAN